MDEQAEKQQAEIESADENQVLNTFEKIYKKFNLFSEIRADDNIAIMIGKIIIRIIGFIIMLILSPFLIIGLIIAFAAAS